METETVQRQLRSAVTSGRRAFMHGVDGRSVTARRHADLLAEFSHQVNRDDPTSKLLVARAASLTVLLERMDAEIASGSSDEKLLTAYAKSAGTLFRILRSLGLASLHPDSRNTRKASLQDLMRKHGVKR